MEIEQKDIRGGQLLNLLHKRCHCGVPELQSCIQRYYHNYFCTCDIWDNWTAINSNSFCVSHGNLCASIFVTVTLQCILFHMSPNGGVLSIYFLSVDWKKMNRLLWHGHQVMFNQLTSWMVYGILQDQYSEFFIRRSASFTVLLLSYLAHINPFQLLISHFHILIVCCNLVNGKCSNWTGGVQFHMAFELLL